MGWRHGHPNERLVRFAYRARRRNHKHCQPVGRPPRYLRARPRRDQLPGLPDLGADQRGVPGCDWRSNTNPKCNSHSNVYSNTNGYRHAKAHSFTKASSDTKAQADSAGKTLIRYRGNRQGATKSATPAYSISG